MVAELLELRSGQVAYVSSLMAGFSLSIAVQILRSKGTSKIFTGTFLLFILTALLFLVALYVDVSLNLRLAGQQDISDVVVHEISAIRDFSTSAATLGFLLFVVSIGVVGWLHSRQAGIMTSLFVAVAMVVILVARSQITGLSL